MKYALGSRLQLVYIIFNRLLFLGYFWNILQGGSAPFLCFICYHLLPSIQVYLGATALIFSHFRA